jgi:hypothetical protein
MRVIFSASGQIVNVTVVKDLPNGLTEQAIKVARRVWFLPAEKNAVPVSVSKVLEYRFSMY